MYNTYVLDGSVHAMILLSSEDMRMAFIVICIVYVVGECVNRFFEWKERRRK